MPQYTFEHRETGEQIDKTMTISEREVFLSENPEYFQVIKPLGVRDNFVASRHTNIPIDTDFKSVLDGISRQNPKNNMQY